jgi:hypothetical protein
VWLAHRPHCLLARSLSFSAEAQGRGYLLGGCWCGGTERSITFTLATGRAKVGSWLLHVQGDPSGPHHASQGRLCSATADHHGVGAERATATRRRPFPPRVPPLGPRTMGSRRNTNVPFVPRPAPSRRRSPSAEPRNGAPTHGLRGVLRSSLGIVWVRRCHLSERAAFSGRGGTVAPSFSHGTSGWPVPVPAAAILRVAAEHRHGGCPSCCLPRVETILGGVSPL